MDSPGTPLDRASDLSSESATVGWSEELRESVAREILVNGERQAPLNVSYRKQRHQSLQPRLEGEYVADEGAVSAICWMLAKLGCLCIVVRPSASARISHILIARFQTRGFV